MAPRAIVADSHYHDREPLSRLLRTIGFDVITAVDTAEIIEIIENEYEIEIVFIDKNISGAVGFINDFEVDIPVVFTGKKFEWEEVRDALRSGAANALVKPLKRSDVEQIIKAKALGIKPKTEKQERKQKSTSVETGIIGEDPSFLKVLEMAQSVADTDSTVLITGETGTGKEVIARYIHEKSLRNMGPFIPVNCGAIPDNLLESELFGHIKGAFTGAIASRPGVFAQASGGTVFLDEIGEMTPSLQVKLLRVLQQKEFNPVGEARPQKADVRIIAATNINLEEAIKSGNFRNDLYYRLNVIPIELPALRERPYDILLLFDFFRKRFNSATGREIEGITEEVEKILMSYQWPGNIRELENLVERLVIIKRSGNICSQDLPVYMAGSMDNSLEMGSGFSMKLTDQGVNLREALEEFENNMIVQALDMTGGNRNKAASLLSMNRTTLVEKLRKKKFLSETDTSEG
ncbi:sigma-54 dependent transcriptional regulator [Myxococcota bacterium]|nr:sigma-54 dependent transcriptional regulator [Myxococcota bacterium]MBU1379756.1 sigma-54 dependent transcriptional regulator [Myxococcota bacterium]MBU1498531.1 sigma-54 dependent transcriptional regulator [Myxococcota bacterium]